MESRWVKSYTVGFIIEKLADLKCWWVTVVPNSHRLILGACCNQVLFDADVQAWDASWVEWINYIFIFWIIWWSLKIDINSHDLVVFSCKANLIISVRESHASDLWRHDTSLKLMILPFFMFVLLRKHNKFIVWSLWILRFLINDNSSVITSNDETLWVSLNALNTKSITWRVRKKHLELTSLFKKHDFTLVSTNN